MCQPTPFSYSSSKELHEKKQKAVDIIDERQGTKENWVSTVADTWAHTPEYSLSSWE